MDKEETTSPGALTPLAADDAIDDLGSDILRSRLLQLYLARVLVNKGGAHDPDECNSMRVEDDEADYADRRAFFDEEEPRKAAAQEEEEEEEEDTVADGDDSDDADLHQVEELPVLRRTSLHLPLPRRHSLAVVGGLDGLSPDEARCELPLGASRPSPRTLEARRLAHFLSAGRRGSLQVSGRSPMDSRGLAPTPEDHADAARSAAWRMESEMRNAWTRRGSLQTDVEASTAVFKAPLALLPRRGSALNLRETDELPGATVGAAQRTKSEVNLTVAKPAVSAAPESATSAREREMKRLEFNIMAPVSF